MLLYERITRGPSFIKFPAAFHGNAKGLIMKLMEGDASRRYGNLRHGAGDVFAHPWFREVDWERLALREIMAPYLPRIKGDGDASAYVPSYFDPADRSYSPLCRFDNYPEENVATLYGVPGPDPYGVHFPDFEYTSTMAP